MISRINKQELLANLLDPWGGNRMLSSVRVWSGLLVLNYHRIGSPENCPYDPGLFSADVETFDAQVKHLKRTYDLISGQDLDSVSRELLDNKASRKRYALITFDDGYRDNYDSAFPVLEANDASAVFFLATGFLDRPSIPWWDEIAWMVHHATVDHIPANTWTIHSVNLCEADRRSARCQLLKTFKSLNASETEPFLNFSGEATGAGRCPQQDAADMWMTWDMVREMHAAGQTIGGHTVHHHLLASMPIDRQDAEIRECRARIHNELGFSPNAFSYPIGKRGAFTQTTETLVQQNGFEYAFAYQGGCTRNGEFDRWAIPRATVEHTTSMAEFRTMTAVPQFCT